MNSRTSFFSFGSKLISAGKDVSLFSDKKRISNTGKLDKILLWGIYKKRKTRLGEKGVVYTYNAGIVVSWFCERSSLTRCAPLEIVSMRDESKAYRTNHGEVMACA